MKRGMPLNYHHSAKEGVEICHRNEASIHWDREKNLNFMAAVCVCRFAQIIWQKCSKTNHTGR